MLLLPFHARQPSDEGMVSWTTAVCALCGSMPCVKQRRLLIAVCGKWLIMVRSSGEENEQWRMSRMRCF